MSLNLTAAVEMKGGGWANMLLTGVGRGITHSAHISVGEKIMFPGGVEMKVTEISHIWEPPGSARAPVSIAYARTIRPISDRLWDQLIALGFKATDDVE